VADQGIIDALMGYVKGMPFGLGIPQGNVTNPQGQTVFPTNTLERMLQGSDDPTKSFAAAFIGPGVKAYHGSKADVTGGFDLRRAGKSDPGLVGKAVYLSPEKEQASSFATSPHYGFGDAPNVSQVQHGMKNPAIIEDGILPDGRRLSEVHPNGITKESAAALNKLLKSQGYDGAVFRVGGEDVQYAVFDPGNVRFMPFGTGQ
jgi:hypothetical protein